ncbi:tRNA 4-thiouridine(8) synthase ThiI [candidate division WOR-3 bacterium]|uniref:tRNA 4-thiouridine(8) synthase ThiI n=1 Tax=candidate division WOR-3 bacterium TaxID=2052148 RepID=A0A937XGA2_UNCW3|nr:tRNA 4-thiouridine(8) synthase ThiI [candidate division WOR-3 bacterium]
MPDKPKATAVALLSGGLDSTLAAKVILEQDITVIGVNFAGAYCPRPFAGKSRGEKAAEKLGIELVTLPIDAEFIAMVKHPKYGRGKNMNPCIDCHTLMIRKAWEYGRKPDCRLQGRKSGLPEGWTADFIITGEVLGQRPMSQNRNALNTVARESGVGDRLLRPMSAKLLDVTAPEREGLVDRERLLDIEGRQRTRQMALAQKYGIKDYPTPAGGCLLTEKVFSKRLAEAFDHGEDSIEIVELLSLGRHFRLPSGVRLVVGRDEAENDELLKRKPEDAAVIDAGDLPGPVGLVLPSSCLGDLVVDPDRVLAARICARYSDKRKEKLARVMIAGEAVEVEPASEEETARLLIA